MISPVKKCANRACSWKAFYSWA